MNKACNGCIYFLSKTRYCVLLGKKIEDPTKPLCVKQSSDGNSNNPTSSGEVAIEGVKTATSSVTPVQQVASAEISAGPTQLAMQAVPESLPGNAVEEELSIEQPLPLIKSFDYVPTGIEVLDEFLGGGFIRGKTYLIAGETGAGKTIFSIQFLLTGAIQYGESGVYVAIDEPTDQLLKGLKRFGWDIEPLIKAGLLRFLDMRTHFSKIYLKDERKKIEPKFIIESILNVVKKAKAKRLVIDPIAPLIYGGSPDDVLYVREFLREMVCALERIGTLTTVMTSEVPTGSKQLSRFGVEEFLASGIIVLGLEEIKGDVRRVMYVRKARWTPAKPVKLIFDIETGKGIVIRGAYRDFI
ncbi:MAG: ATPase domain-containing protein [Thermofilaceae archaeon]